MSNPSPPSAPAPASSLPSSFLPPPTLVEILSSFQLAGGGDRDLLLAILSAKQSEDERLRAEWNLQTQTLASWSDALQKASLANGAVIRAPGKRAREETEEIAQGRDAMRRLSPPAEPTTSSSSPFPSRVGPTFHSTTRRPPPSPVSPSSSGAAPQFPFPSSSSFASSSTRPPTFYGSHPASFTLPSAPPPSHFPPSSVSFSSMPPLPRSRSVLPKTSRPPLNNTLAQLAEGHARAMSAVRARLEAARRNRGSSDGASDSEGTAFEPPLIVVSASSRPSSAISVERSAGLA